MRIPRVVVGAFVALQVAASCADCVPRPSSLDQKRAREPAVHAELAAWAQRLHMAPDVLTAFAIDAATDVRAASALLRAPFGPYLDVTGQRQSWMLFAVPPRTHHRFVLETRACDTCDWRVAYRSKDPEHRALASILEDERTVGAVDRWSMRENEPARDLACHALATRLFDADESAQQVRCGFEPTPRLRGQPAFAPVVDRASVAP